MSRASKHALFCLILPTLFAMLCTAGDDAVTNATTELKAFHLSEMDPDFRPKLGVYSYSIHWLMKTGARAEISIERAGDHYYMTTTARTGKFVDLFYRVRYRGEAELDVGTLAPDTVEVDETVRSTYKHTVMDFDDGVISATRTRWKKNKPPFSVKEQKIDTHGGTIMDYFSTILIARAISWSEGDSRSVVVFDGRGLNNVTLDCVGMKALKVKGEKTDTWHIKIKIVQEGDVDEDDELIADNIHLYLTDDAAREIVLIQADTPYGDIRAKLDDFKTIPGDPEYSDHTPPRGGKPIAETS
jgi:hypothetical protein